MNNTKENNLDIKIVEEFKPDDFEKVSYDKNKILEDKNKSNKKFSYWLDVKQKFLRNKISVVSLLVIIFFVVFAFFGPLFVNYKYDQQIRGSEDLFPFQYSEEEQERILNGEKVFVHICGTDNHGRDILVRLMYGTRISVSIGFTASLLVLFIGFIYGAVAGFFGGIVDNIMMRIIEIISSIPDILVILLISVTIKPITIDLVNKNIENYFGKLIFALGPGIIAIFISFGLMYWISTAKIIRGQIMQLKNQEFILAAKVIGASNFRIIFKHLLPNCFGVMISSMCLEIPTAIFLESLLSFLGLGVAAPMTSLGAMTSDGLSGMYTYTYRLIIPAVLLSIMILAFNLLGDGLRDALDSKTC